MTGSDGTRDGLGSASFLAEMSVRSPQIYLFILSNEIFSGPKYPKKKKK